MLRSVISNDYVVYLQELENDLGIDNNSVSFSEGINGDSSDKWLDTMKDEFKSLMQNDVDLMEFPKGGERVGCKWIFKTKCDSGGNIEHYNAQLVVKGFTQKNGTDYKETFLHVSKKDSFRIIMTLVTHYDLELDKMNVKIAFLNKNLEDDVYMDQPVGFIEEGKEHMMCKLKNSIYELKQTSRQWYIKFNDTYYVL